MQISEALAYLNKTAKIDKRMTAKLKKWRDVYYGISLHTKGACPAFKDPATGAMVTPPGFMGKEYQNLFDLYLMSRHPREGEAIRNYRYSQYRPLTKAPMGQCIEIISGAIFQDSNYRIDIPDKQDEKFIYENRFSGYDLIGYFANIGIKHIIEDPNGLFLRIPNKPYYEQIGKRVEVDIWFVGTDEIVFLNDTDLIFKCEDEDYAYWVDTSTVWRFTYDPNKKNWYLAPDDAEGYYAHMLGKLPVTVAGGEWNTDKYFESYFDKAKATADDFISSYSAAQLVDKEASHPFITTINKDCETCHGQRQFQICSTCNSLDSECQCESSNFKLSDCPTCKGSGKQSQNPMQWIYVAPDQIKDGAIKIDNPDVALNKHHREVVAAIMEQIMNVLHLRKIDKAESGAAKAIDQERLYQFISKISNHVFDKNISDTIADFIAYRNVTNVSGMLAPAQYDFQILKPTQFQIKTASDLLGDYKTGTEANLPAFIRLQMANDYADKAYSGDLLMKKKAKVITALDVLSVSSADEMLSLRAANAVTNEDITISIKLPSWIDELINEKGQDWFLSTTVSDIDKALQPFRNKLSPTGNDLIGKATASMQQ